MRAPSSASPYEQVRSFPVYLNGQEILVFSKPGLPDWDRVTAPVSLLAQAVELFPTWRVLLLGCGFGALGVFLARQVDQGEVWLTDHRMLALDLSGQTLDANEVENAHLLDDIQLPSNQQGSFDAAILVLPKGRKLAQRWLLEAQIGLREGGSLYVAGANEAGIQPAVRDAEALFGPAAILGYKKGSRAARLVRRETPRKLPDWTKEPGISPGSWYEFEAEAAGQAWRLWSLPGVFSFDKVDEGSRLLLECLRVPPDGRVLDLGCGYGILGLAATKLGAGWVDLVDGDLLAVASARENLTQHGITNASALASDVAFAVREQRYSLVITNPPFHTGKEVDYEVARAFITQARQVLNPGGQLLLVANRFIRYEYLVRELFVSAERVAETSKYHVLSAQC